jgi:hypothetical protein
LALDPQLITSPASVTAKELLENELIPMKALLQTLVGNIAIPSSFLFFPIFPGLGAYAPKVCFSDRPSYPNLFGPHVYTNPLSLDYSTICN